MQEGFITSVLSPDESIIATLCSSALFKENTENGRGFQDEGEGCRTGLENMPWSEGYRHNELSLSGAGLVAGLITVCKHLHRERSCEAGRQLRLTGKGIMSSTRTCL